MEAAEKQSLFSYPSRDFVEHATRELGWEERLTVYKMAASLGTSTSQVYNFRTLVNQLFGTRWDRLLDDSGKEALVWVDSAELVTWLRDVIGDAELASAVEAEFQSEDGYKFQIDALLPLFKERVAQYMEVLDAAKASE